MRLAGRRFGRLPQCRSGRSREGNATDRGERNSCQGLVREFEIMEKIQMHRHYRTRYQLLVVLTGVLSFFLLSGFGWFHHKKYETPITKETLQPDKVLFDKAIRNIEHGDYEAARLTLNTLINTYDTSEFLAKAKLAIADSWFREGGPHGLAEAEAE